MTDYFYALSGSVQFAKGGKEPFAPHVPHQQTKGPSHYTRTPDPLDTLTARGRGEIRVKIVRSEQASE